VSAPHGRVTVNGVELAYLEAGPADGPLALCLHGFPDTPTTWSQLLPALADAGFHVVAPWLRGYAPSGFAPDGNYQVANLALDAIGVADALAGDGDAYLIGHDWGAIATHAAVGHAPQRWKKVVTIAVPHPVCLARHMFDLNVIKSCWYQQFFQTPAAAAVVPMNNFAFIDLLWSDWSPDWEWDPAHMADVKECLGTPGVIEAAIDYYRFVFGTNDADPALADVQRAFLMPTQTPALHFQGERDGVYPASLCPREELEPAYPAGLELETVPGAGHFLQLEKPDAVNTRIVEFLGS
jgi:pimeloyl-ACP methyl ester carboxylesterase